MHCLPVASLGWLVSFRSLLPAIRFQTMQLPDQGLPLSRRQIGLDVFRENRHQEQGNLDVVEVVNDARATSLASPLRCPSQFSQAACLGYHITRFRMQRDISAYE